MATPRQPGHEVFPQHPTANGASVQSIKNSHSQSSAASRSGLQAVRRADDWEDAITLAVDEFARILSSASSRSGSPCSIRRSPRSPGAINDLIWFGAARADLEQSFGSSDEMFAGQGVSETSSRTTAIPDSADSSSSSSCAESWSPSDFSSTMLAPTDPETIETSSGGTAGPDWGDSSCSLSSATSRTMVAAADQEIFETFSARKKFWSFSLSHLDSWAPPDVINASQQGQTSQPYHNAGNCCQSCRYMGLVGACRPPGYKNPFCCTVSGCATAKRMQIRNLARMIHVATGTPIFKRCAATQLAAITKGDERLRAYAAGVCRSYELWVIPTLADSARLHQPPESSQVPSFFLATPRAKENHEEPVSTAVEQMCTVSL